MAPRAYGCWPAEVQSRSQRAIWSMPHIRHGGCPGREFRYCTACEIFNRICISRTLRLRGTVPGPADATFGRKFRSGQCLDPRAALYRNVRECGRDYLRFNRSFAGIMSTFFISCHVSGFNGKPTDPVSKPISRPSMQLATRLYWPFCKNIFSDSSW